MYNNNVRNIARAGGLGVCSLYCIGGGITFLLPGVIMMIVAFGDDTWEDDFFDSMRTIAVILFVVGLGLTMAGIVLCYFVRRSINEASRNNQSGQNAPMVVTGYNPGGTTYPTGQATYPQGYCPPAAQGYQPSAQGYPPQGQQYPPQGQQYPPQGQQYPPQQYPPPGQQYPPVGGGAQPYPPAQPYPAAYPPPQGYDMASAPTAPPADGPPPYDSATEMSKPPIQ